MPSPTHCQHGDQLDDHTIDRLARTAWRAELGAMTSAPHTRALFWLGLLVGTELTGLAWLFAANLHYTARAALLTAPVWWLIGILLTTWATTRLRTHTTYRAAWRVAWITTPTGTAVARIRHTTPEQYLVEGVAAWPLNTGLGSHVITALTDLADDQHLTLTLTATSRRVARFYQRHGWQPLGTHRNRSLGYPMTRPPQQRYSGPTEHTQSVSAGTPRTPQTPHPHRA